MAALTGDRKIEFSEGLRRVYPVAADAVIWSGALVCLDADGYATPAADTAGLVFVGMAVHRADNTDGVDGAIGVELMVRGDIRVKGSGLTQAGVGRSVCAVDDQTVAAAATTTNDIPVGTLTAVVSATDGWVAIG